MRPYRTVEYKNSLVGNKLNTCDSDLKHLNGKKVKKVIRELTDKEYDRELLDDSDKNEFGKSRYELNCMYEVQIGKEVIQVYEDEINPEYKGDFEE